MYELGFGEEDQLFNCLVRNTYLYLLCVVHGTAHLSTHRRLSYYYCCTTSYIHGLDYASECENNKAAAPFDLVVFLGAKMSTR